MVHDNVSLTVSAEEATRVEEEAKRRLLASRKLSLVVDLDQTIIHATVDPTVEEWQIDQNNPNHEAVKDVRKFKLVDDGPGARGCWYYIKLRPGLRRFLETVSALYELHIYTMGTRLYAQNIANIVDPERKIFGDRILSRDESGSLTAKNLQRLFPVDTKMVVIIDDRGDVWKWSDNLIKVTPYDFFVGIGDINSSFLPKKSEPRTSVPLAIPNPNKDLAEGATVKEPVPILAPDGPGTSVGTTESLSSSASALEQLVLMGGGDDPNTLQAQASKQDETLTAQLQDRPLLQKQKQLEADDEAAAAAPLDNDSLKDARGDEPNSDPGKHRHNLLQDDDRELQHLERSLRKVHSEFFDLYNQRLAGAQGGRIAQLRGEKHAKKVPISDKGADLKLVPDIKTIMPQMKLRVLEGVSLVFSGVVPLGTDIQNSDIALWAKSFGAQITENITKRTTHVIAARNRTAKVRQAARRRKIKIVTTQWLFDSISQWQRVDEEPYLIPVHPEDRGEPTSSLPGSSPSKDGVYYDAKVDDSTILSSSEEDGGVTDDDVEPPVPVPLSINTEDMVDDADGLIPFNLDDDNSPVGGTNEDWDQMKNELADFLGSDADDSDNESSLSESSVKSSKSTNSLGPSPKRKFDEVEPDSSDGDDKVNGETRSAPAGRSSLEKRVKKAYQRSTSLTKVATASTPNSEMETSSGLPTPEPTGDADLPKANAAGTDNVNGGGENGDDGNGDDDDDWGDLEADLEAELQRQSEEDGQGGEGNDGDANDDDDDGDNDNRGDGER